MKELGLPAAGENETPEADTSADQRHRSEEGDDSEDRDEEAEDRAA